MEAHSKFPLPPYPHEDDYEDPICYKHDCKKYEDTKLKVLDKRNAWAKWEQEADAEHAAIAAQAQAEEEKCLWEAKEQAAASWSSVQLAKKCHCA